MVSDYGKVLLGRARAEPTDCPNPCCRAKERIRTAIRVLLDHVPADQVELREGQHAASIYLAQFVADDDAALIAEARPLCSGPVGNSGNRRTPYQPHQARRGARAGELRGGA